MGWFEKLLIGLLSGYMGYVFILATINPIHYALEQVVDELLTI